MKNILRVMVPLAGVAILATGAFAQGGGGWAPPPGMEAKMKAWQKFRENHKHVGQVQQTINGIAECEKDPRTALTKAQARQVQAVLAAWRNKPVMSDDQAIQVNKQLTAKLTAAQIKKIAMTPAFGRRGGGGGGGGGWGGGGGGARPAGGGGGGGGFTMPDPKESNPLNPDSSPFGGPMKERGKQRLNDLNAKLSTAK